MTSTHVDRHQRYISSVPLADRIERYATIRAARDAGLTLGAIGSLFDPPMTKQRVERILAAGPPRSQAGGRPPRKA